MELQLLVIFLALLVLNALAAPVHNGMYLIYIKGLLHDSLQG